MSASSKGARGLVFPLALLLTTTLACGNRDAGLAPAGGTPLGRFDMGGSRNQGIWISLKELASVPAGGEAWAQLKGFADRWPGLPDLSNQDQENNVLVLAKALLYARTGAPHYRDDVRDQCLLAIDTELEGRTLALGRELAAYVIAADLVGLEPGEDEVFRAWLERCLTEELEGRTLQGTHEDRPNNWGTHAGASRAAVAVYLGDDEELARTAQVFKGWLGDRDSYAGFTYGELDWQANENEPVGINPVTAVKDGEFISGVIPDDMRRGGGFEFPPGATEYPWEALQGAVVLAEILHRQGYDAWEWENRALLRAVKFLWALHQRFPEDGWWPGDDDDDLWIVWLINHVYGTDYPVSVPARAGKNMGWTDWTHAQPRKR